ncbi:MAG: InlB B-repeat-containing protein [Clostridia bacterium]|nr:InlB B-repeat-containing protein [Clostridia bacterium]
MKKRLLAILFALCLVFTLVACDAAQDVITGNSATGLPAPTGVRIEGGYVTWNPVEYATKYTISIDGKEYFCDENKYPASSIKDGEHIIKAKANGDGIRYSTSPYSEELKVNLIEGAIASSGYYSQFDELTMQESFLGYGFDVINSSVFYDKTVKTSSPIFKTDELMNLRLLKVDSKSNYISEVQSESIDTFMEEWNAGLNVNVSWGKKKVGGSVSVSTNFSGGSETAKSKYFHVMTFNNQKFYIVMQGTTDQYRAMLSEGFEKDLYSDMSPAELFNKYGTHFITGAVMGGKINSYYLYTSEEETDFFDMSAKVSTSVRAWSAKTDVSVETGYRQEAESKRIYIKNTLEVLGGGDFAMLADTDIGAMYGDWQKSLEDHSSLIGIKDSGSLWPIWDLIDPEKDTSTDYIWVDEDGVEQKGSRAEQLQGYFMKYGIENYNILAQNAGIPEIKQPTSIDSVLVNGREAVNGEYEVFAGTENRVTFTVSPDDAIGYTKSIRLSTPNDYVTISDDNTELIIDATIPNNTVLSVVVSAGDIKKTITVRVSKTYSVEFETNLDGVEIEDPIRYRELRYGRQISSPKLLNVPYEYVFLGWYKDPYFITEYNFGSDPITDNIILYAKWEEYKPEIKFITNIDGYTIDPVYVNYGDIYTPSFTPSYAGYKFEAYCVDADLTSGFNFEKPVTTDITIYLKWSPVTYTITFVADGKVVGTDNFTVEDKNITIPAVPEKTGFYGTWESYTLGTDSITVNAVYSEKPIYTLTFLDGTNTIAILTFNEDNMSSITEPTPPTKKGYYSAWESYTLSPVDTIVNVVYTPKPTYTATFYADGDIVKAISFNEDTIDTVVAPAVPEKTGYTAAWEDYTIIASNISIHAVYTLNVYTITYMTNGAVYDTDIYNVEEPFVMPKLYDNNIYSEFNYHLGWCYDIECTQEFDEDITQNPRNLTLYAKWLTISGDRLLDTSVFTDGEMDYIIYGDDDHVDLKVSPSSSENKLPTKYEIDIHSYDTINKYHIGGIEQPNNNEANTVYYEICYAKIPVGYYLLFGHNPSGEGAKFEGITPMQGTGEWQWYIFKYTAGSEANYGTLGYVAIHETGDYAKDADWSIGYFDIIKP